MIRKTYFHLEKNCLSGTLYEQVIYVLRARIFSGVYKPESQMPSIRNLSEELSCSVITVKRAYEELKREGLIRTRSGKGTYVTKINDEEIKEKCIQEIKNSIFKALRVAEEYQISVNDVQMVFEECKEQFISESKSSSNYTYR